VQEAVAEQADLQDLKVLAETVVAETVHLILKVKDKMVQLILVAEAVLVEEFLLHVILEQVVLVVQESLL
jgi:hypothetical protein